MNGNANGTRPLARMELEFKGHSYEFTLNPEIYEIKIPNRMNLQYTKGGAFIDAFGAGLKEISIIGTTGFRGQTGNPEHGYNKFIELKKLIEDSMNGIEEGEQTKDFLNFYNHTDGEAYVCIANRLNLSRNVNQPLLYKYDIDLYAIRRVGDPVPQGDIQEIGNPIGTPDTSTETVKDRDELEKDGKNSKFTESHKEDELAAMYDDGILMVEVKYVNENGETVIERTEASHAFGNERYEGMTGTLFRVPKPKER